MLHAAWLHRFLGNRRGNPSRETTDGYVLENVTSPVFEWCGEKPTAEDSFGGHAGPEQVRDGDGCDNQNNRDHDKKFDEREPS